MADHQDRTFVLFKSTFEFIFGVHIQVVSWLVKDQNIIFTIHEETETDLSLLTTRKHLNLTLNVLRSQATSCQGCADLCLIKSWKCIPDRFKRRLTVSSRNFLFKIAQLQILTTLNFPTKSWNHSQQTLQKSGFTDTVSSDNGNLLVALKGQIERLASQYTVVSDFQILGLEDKTTWCSCHLEIKTWFWFFSL
ncbi:Uncharacterised protein [Chlamydia trachomatis]|nr:Uncharacterised protein [Chlamydia trachomatis]